MPIIVRLDRVMADRKILLKDLADEVGITNVNLSKLKKWKSSRCSFFDFRKYLPCTGLPTRRYIRIFSG